MNITQETLINQIAAGEAIPAEMVRQTLKSAENIIFNYFSSVPPSEEVNIKLFPGLSMKRNYIETRKYSKGMFRNKDCPEHVNVKASLSRYYIGQLNQRLFQRQDGSGAETQDKINDNAMLKR